MERNGTRKGEIKGVELQTDEDTPEVCAESIGWQTNTITQNGRLIRDQGSSS
jgi:hypothetical protein